MVPVNYSHHVVSGIKNADVGHVKRVHFYINKYEEGNSADTQHSRTHHLLNEYKTADITPYCSLLILLSGTENPVNVTSPVRLNTCYLQ